MAKKKAVDAEALRAELTKRLAVPPPDYEAGLSTGSTLLNLACTGRPDVGFMPGGYFFMAGVSDGGKTWIGLTGMAEAACNPMYDDYQLIYDAPERGAQMDMAKHFGQKMADRLQPPYWRGEHPWPSETVEDFYVNLQAAMDKGPCIYLLDSMDALSSEAEEKQTDELVKTTNKRRKAEQQGDAGPEIKGSYGDGKAKKNSSMIRQMISSLDATRSILVVICQTRDNLRSPFGGKTHAGGHSLAFYAQVRVWSSVLQKETKEVRGTKRHVGNLCQFHVERSRFTGRQARVEVPLYFGTGLDDTGSLIDYLTDEKHWKKGVGGIDAKELGLKSSREKLIEDIEQSDELVATLRQTAAKVWQEVAAEMMVERKQKYS